MSSIGERIRQKLKKRPLPAGTDKQKGSKKRRRLPRFDLLETEKSSGRNWERYDASKRSSLLLMDEQASSSNPATMAERTRRQAIIAALQDESTDCIAGSAFESALKVAKSNTLHEAAIFGKSGAEISKETLDAASIPAVPTTSRKKHAVDKRDSSIPVWKRVKKNDRVIVKWHVDNQWYEALVVSISGALFHVRFLHFDRAPVSVGFDSDAIRILGEGGSGYVATPAGRKKNIFCRNFSATGSCPHEKCVFLHDVIDWERERATKSGIP